jgi:hypothetical protein
VGGRRCLEPNRKPDSVPDTYFSLAELASVQEQLRDRLQEVAPPVSPELEAAWQAAAGAMLAEEPDKPRWGGEQLESQYYVLITCRDEKQQVELLSRFLGEGLECKAVLG